MKFWTFESWAALQDWESRSNRSEDDDPSIPYIEHIKRISGSLPPGLLDLAIEVHLHDLNLTSLLFAGDTATLLAHWESAQTSVKLLGVKRFEMISRDEGLLGVHSPSGLGTIGYKEVDLAGDGLFELRVLFSSGVEMHFLVEDAVVEYPA